MERWWRLQC